MHGLKELQRTIQKTSLEGTSLEVQWLRLRASDAGCAGLIPGWETKIPHATQRSQEKKIKNKKKTSLDIIC